MKANEAPKKIYMPNELLSEEWTRHIEGEDIEYTRTDAFVDKASEWLRENFLFDEAGYCKTNIYSTESMIYNFKKYIRG